MKNTSIIMRISIQYIHIKYAKRIHLNISYPHSHAYIILYYNLFYCLDILAFMLVYFSI
jgi:hypothetical protein